MLKFTNSLTNAKLVLVRRHMSDGSCAALIVMRNPHRRYATEQKPDPSCRAPPEAPKSHKLFWGAIGATILTGAAVVYAKNSPRTRNWLESNAPWANDLVALVYQENTTYWKAASNQFNRTTTYLGEFLFGKEGVTPTELKNRSDQDIEKDAEEHFSKKSYQSTLIQTDKCEPQTTVVIKITKDMVELEHDMHENVKIAIDNYKLATSFCDEYNKALFKIVETSVDDLEKKHYSGLAGLNVQKENAAKKAREASAKAKLALETLDRMIKSGQMQAPPESLATTKRYIKQFRADLTSAEDTYAQELAKSSLSEKYWNKVEAARGMFREELQALFPGIDLCAKKLDIKGDVDLLLAYTLQKVQYLQNQLAELQTVRDLKINRAIECNDEKALIEAKAEDIIRNERSAMEAEYLKKSIQIQSEANRQTKEALKKQMELQQEVMQARLAKREQEMMANFARAVSEEVEAERVEFKKELAAMAGKLKAIEDTLKQRSGAEAEARRSQSLWTAAEALLAATRRSVPDTKVDNELKALEKAGKDDKLVETVLKGIPPDVREKGIVTEKALRERFEKMEQTAVKVALVGRDGATLPVYFMSWLQSLLLFKKFSDIPKDELDNKPTDFTQLDTFDIMQRARYHMDHGNLPAALRYVNLLQGAPRAAARAWADAARRHLEIRQAAEAVMAHASVSSLLYH
ncbi:MICOS complex subunit Mic60-like isoform X2 [Helicoverpa zea]|uniref:MICOS complex subunit Mic60-like isoform X2 n=1 Tax=Helicoverpa zea TaxID=7113 RepID=UPI001F58FF17|nr:MICOS complex subunit Mic60-like isoform X2 [Helicoverpa zea]